MKFPKYWKVVRNSTGTVVARGWSNLSEEEAGQLAEQRLQRILNWLRSNRSQDLDRYSYVADDSICEPVIDQVVDDDGGEIAIISRNAYGALVLNSASVMIVDIDIESTIPRPGFVAKIFGAKPPSVEVVLEQRLVSLRDWQLQNPKFAFRIYRTAAGLRVIFSSQVFEVDATVIGIMDQMQGDPRYRELCISQKCFRARLTPKPWRIGLLPPAQKFPFSSKAQEIEFDEWFSRYTEAAKGWTVCRLLEAVGDAPLHPTAQQIIELHDHLCCHPNLRLA